MYRSIYHCSRRHPTTHAQIFLASNKDVWQLKIRQTLSLIIAQALKYFDLRIPIDCGYSDLAARIIRWGRSLSHHSGVLGEDPHCARSMISHKTAIVVSAPPTWSRIVQYFFDGVICEQNRLIEITNHERKSIRYSHVFIYRYRGQYRPVAGTTCSDANRARAS